jgi:hypothetical protein
MVGSVGGGSDERGEAVWGWEAGPSAGSNSGRTGGCRLVVRSQKPARLGLARDLDSS